MGGKGFFFNTFSDLLFHSSTLDVFGGLVKFSLFSSNTRAKIFPFFYILVFYGTPARRFYPPSSEVHHNTPRHDTPPGPPSSFASTCDMMTRCVVSSGLNASAAAAATSTRARSSSSSTSRAVVVVVRSRSDSPWLSASGAPRGQGRVEEEGFGGRRAGLSSRGDAILARAAAGGDNGGDDENERYYQSWARYPDDPSVPPEITQILRQVGDGEADVWATKPPWCQPWTIGLTGSLIVYAPTLVFHAKWLSALVALPIAAWWYVFLVAYPKQFREYVESARSYYDKR